MMTKNSSASATSRCFPPVRWRRARANDPHRPDGAPASQRRRADHIGKPQCLNARKASTRSSGRSGTSDPPVRKRSCQSGQEVSQPPTAAEPRSRAPHFDSVVPSVSAWARLALVSYPVIRNPRVAIRSRRNVRSRLVGSTFSSRTTRNMYCNGVSPCPKSGLSSGGISAILTKARSKEISLWRRFLLPGGLPAPGLQPPRGI